MSTGPKKDNRGGARPNSGPKKRTVSASQLKAMREAAEAYAEKHNKSFWDVCLDWVYDESLPVNTRQAAWKMYGDKMIVSVAEGGDADQTAGPAVYLPEQRPQLKAVPGGKSE